MYETRSSQPPFSPELHTLFPEERIPLQERKRSISSILPCQLPNLGL